ncbi:MAG: Crp/Fnr family transcriptional regulator [Treponema sp. CETP13]|nr:MAG: Crp/Fnr family transcriptional regulator [Treponema sp. CETP13]
MSFRSAISDKSEFDNLFPRWNKLEPNVQKILHSQASFHSAKKGTILQSDENHCIGLVLVNSGQLRVYMMSDEGKEITLYRLFSGDMCLLSASCILSSIQFEVIVETEKNSNFWIIPSTTYKTLMAQSLPLCTYTNELMSARFSDVMWVMQQVLFKSMDERLSEFLLDETNREDNEILKITHEQIAHHLGTAREVITRLLKYLQDENAISLSRGIITIKDRSLLEERVHTPLTE